MTAASLSITFFLFDRETSDHEHDHDHEHEVITLVDDEGNETLYEILLTIDGQESNT
jgi:uncharacterized protein YrzB (UPF0473 family)